jgi:hypothetical protein
VLRLHVVGTGIVGAGNMHMEQLISETLQQGMAADALADRVDSCCNAPQQFGFLGEERAGRLVLEVVAVGWQLGLDGCEHFFDVGL